MAERIGGKLEAGIAGAVLIVVIVLFAKYYDRGQGTDTADSKPAVKLTTGVQ